MLNFTSFKRQEINLVFKIKVFVVSKIWYFNKSIYLYFPKTWVVTPATSLSTGRTGRTSRAVQGRLATHRPWTPVLLRPEPQLEHHHRRKM
jgi:hypothetical protein